MFKPFGVGFLLLFVIVHEGEFFFIHICHLSSSYLDWSDFRREVSSSHNQNLSLYPYFKSTEMQIFSPSIHDTLVMFKAGTCVKIIIFTQESNNVTSVCTHLPIVTQVLYMSHNCYKDRKIYYISCTTPIDIRVP